MKKDSAKNYLVEKSKVLIEKNLRLVRGNSNAFDLLLKALEQNNINWAIVGGAPRSWALQQNKMTLNDIDLVINADDEKIRKLIEYISYPFLKGSIKQTKFNGYRIRTDSLDFDLWSVKNTIGIKKNKVFDNNLYRSVSKSAALSLDSIVYTCKGALYERGFFETMHSRVLTLNHSDVVRPESIAKKALRLCKEFDLIPDISLQAFILSYIESERDKVNIYYSNHRSIIYQQKNFMISHD